MFTECPEKWGADFLANTWFSDESYIEVWPSSYGNRGVRGEKVELNVPKHGGKLMVFACFNEKGAWHKTFPAGTTMDGKLYREGLGGL